MKGIVFVEFLKLVENQFSTDMVDTIIDAAELPSNGAYTSVGYYDHTEMVKLVSVLSEKTGIAVTDLLKLYGNYLFSRFYNLFPQYFQGADTAFDFLDKVDKYIHAEVLKLYPDAQLPKIIVISRDETNIVMEYQSPRHFNDLAYGLIEGCFTYYQTAVTIKMQPSVNQSGATEFILSLE